MATKKSKLINSSIVISKCNNQTFLHGSNVSAPGFYYPAALALLITQRVYIDLKQRVFLLDLRTAITKILELDLSEYQPSFLFEKLIGFKEKWVLKKERSKATDLFEELIPNNDVRSLFLLYRNIP